MIKDIQQMERNRTIMVAVYKKELGQFFHSFIGYIYLAVFSLLSGGFFVIFNLLPANGDIRDFYSPLMSSTIFLLPMLTMRTYSEERKTRTEQLLMSAPVSSGAVAVGKFFAVLTLFATGLLFTLPHILTLAFLGKFDLLVILGNIAGMIVSASSFIAIGLLISSFTDNQIVACIITYAVLLGLSIIGKAQSYIPNDTISAIVSYISLSDRFAEFSMGIFDFATIIYYLSVTVFFLFMISILNELRRCN